eukprot:scpid91301/ scgid24629/ 
MEAANENTATVDDVTAEQTGYNEERLGKLVQKIFGNTVPLDLFRALLKHSWTFPGGSLTSHLPAWTMEKEGCTEDDRLIYRVGHFILSLTNEGTLAPQDGPGFVYIYTSPKAWWDPSHVKIGMTKLADDSRLKQQEKCWRSCNLHLKIPANYHKRAEKIVHKLLGIDTPTALTRQLFRLACHNARCRTRRSFLKKRRTEHRDHIGHREWFAWTSKKRKQLLAIITQEFDALLLSSPSGNWTTEQMTDFVEKLIRKVFPQGFNCNWLVMASPAEDVTLSGELQHRLGTANSTKNLRHVKRKKRWLRKLLSLFLIAYAIEVV